MLTPDQLAALRAAAEAATPGQWRTGGSKPDSLHEITVYGSQVVVDTDIGPKVLMEGNGNFYDEAAANAAFVAAANPAMVLALLDNIDAQAARIAELERLNASNELLLQILKGTAQVWELDAARWRYAVENGFPRSFRQIHPTLGLREWHVGEHTPGAPTYENPDAAIDAAMAQQDPS